MGFVVGSLLMARFADRLREGAWIVASVLSMGLVGVLYALSPTLFGGLGHAGLIVLAILLVMLSGFLNAPSSIARRLLMQRNTPREMRGRIFSSFFVGLPLGIWGGAGALAQGLAPAIGGALTSGLGWAWIFWFQVAVAAIVAWLGLVAASESRDDQAERHVDVTGLTLAVGALTTFTLAVIQAPTWGLAAPTTLILLGASVVLAIAFVAVERRARAPLVDLSLFRHRNFTGATLVLFILNFALIAALFLLPLFMQEQLGYSAVKAGILLMPITVGMVVGSPLGGPVAERVGPLPPLVAGSLMIAVAMFVMAGIDLRTSYADIWPPAAVLGLGIGLSLTPMNLAAMNSVPTRQSGQAGGVFTTLSGVGIGLGVAVSGAVFNHVQLAETQAKAAAGGVQLSRSSATELDGLLAGASDAMHALMSFGAGARRVIEEAVHEAFVLGIGSGLRFGAFIALAGLVVALALIRRETPADERA